MCTACAPRYKLPAGYSRAGCWLGAKRSQEPATTDRKSPSRRQKRCKLLTHKLTAISLVLGCRSMQRVYCKMLLAHPYAYTCAPMRVAAEGREAGATLHVAYCMLQTRTLTTGIYLWSAALLKRPWREAMSFAKDSYSSALPTFETIWTGGWVGGWGFSAEHKPKLSTAGRCR